VTIFSVIKITITICCLCNGHVVYRGIVQISLRITLAIHFHLCSCNYFVATTLFTVAYFFVKFMILDLFFIFHSVIATKKYQNDDFPCWYNYLI
jgi:hypothetical protein